MTTEAFPLLDLPKDIRLIIYEHLPSELRTIISSVNLY
jgi:hypothetical protein